MNGSGQHQQHQVATMEWSSSKSNSCPVLLLLYAICEGRSLSSCVHSLASKRRYARRGHAPQKEVAKTSVDGDVIMMMQKNF